MLGAVLEQLVALLRRRQTQWLKTNIAGVLNKLKSTGHTHACMLEGDENVPHLYKKKVH